MQKQVIPFPDYAWGALCADGLSVGLSVAGRTFKTGESVPWRWALRSTSATNIQVIVEHDLDTRFRYSLGVFAGDTALPLREFPPSVDPLPTSSDAMRTIKLVKDVAFEVETNEVCIGAELGAGVYRLRLRFGGPGFDFHCVSGAVQIQVE